MAHTYLHQTANSAISDQDWIRDITDVFKNKLRWTGLTITPVANNFILEDNESSGIKVGGSSNPIYSWMDLSGVIHYDRDSPSITPTFNTFKGNIKKYQFDVDDQVFIDFRIPSDYVTNTHIFIHAQWATSTNSSGPVTWQTEATYGSANNNLFSNNVTVNITNQANLAYRHLTKEVQLSSFGGVGNLIRTEDLNHDGIILMRFKLSTNPSGIQPFLLYTGLHYQSRVVGTKDRNN